MRGPGVLVVFGLLAILAGTMALAFPAPASFTANFFVGGSLVVTGIAGVWGALAGAGRRDTASIILLGLATAVLGFILLLFPDAGLATLTMVIGIIFVASGVLKLVLGFHIRRRSWRWAVMAAGALSLLLGFMIFTGLPGAAYVVPGLLMAVELLCYGWGMLFLGIAWRNRGC